MVWIGVAGKCATLSVRDPDLADDYVIRQASLPIRFRLDQTLLGREK